MKKALFVIQAAVMLLWFGATEARAVMCIAIPAYSSNSDTTVGVGLRFDFGDMNPEVVGIVRHTHANTSNTVVGAQGEISIPLFNNGSYAPSIRALGLLGKPTVLGQAGGGYNFGTQQLFGSAGVQGPYVEGGLNFTLDGGLDPYVGLTTLDKAAQRKANAPPPP